MGRTGGVFLSSHLIRVARRSGALAPSRDFVVMPLVDALRRSRAELGWQPTAGVTASCVAISPRRRRLAKPAPDPALRCLPTAIRRTRSPLGSRPTVGPGTGRPGQPTGWAEPPSDFLTLSTWASWSDIEAATGADLRRPITTQHASRLVSFEAEHLEIVPNIVRATEQSAI